MTRLAKTFAALSDPTRLATIERLMDEGELSVGTLLETADMSAPALSRHLKVLREAGLVMQREAGTKRIYSVRPEAMRAIADWTIDRRAFWEAGLDRMAVHLALEGDTE